MFIYIKGIYDPKSVFDSFIWTLSYHYFVMEQNFVLEMMFLYLFLCMCKCVSISVYTTCEQEPGEVTSSAAGVISDRKPSDVGAGN